MALWATELGVYAIQYIPRMAMKSQVPMDFVVELTIDDEGIKKKAKAFRSKWSLYVGGSSNARGSEAGMLLRNPNGDLLEHSLRFGFSASNTKVEYEALVAGLVLAKRFGATSLKIFSDF